VSGIIVTASILAGCTPTPQTSAPIIEDDAQTVGLYDFSEQKIVFGETDIYLREVHIYDPDHQSKLENATDSLVNKFGRETKSRYFVRDGTLYEKVNEEDGYTLKVTIPIVLGYELIGREDRELADEQDGSGQDADYEGGGQAQEADR